MLHPIFESFIVCVCVCWYTMKFSTFIDIYTADSAYKTLKMLKVSKNIPSFKTFFERLIRAEIQYVPMKFFQSVNNIDPAVFEAKTVTDVYGKKGKDRGQKDLDSVAQLRKSECVSPIILYKYRKQVYLLDGMHRLTAARLEKLPRIAYVIP